MWFYVVLALIILFILSYVLSLAEKKLKNIQKSNKINDNIPLPYYLTKSVLTKSELNFYKVLLNYVDNNSLILSKVSLQDIFKIGKSTYSSSTTFRNKIARKHVDFLICDKNTLSPLYAIELDDSSHMREDRQERDSFIDKVYSHVGLKLIHIKAKYNYTESDFIEILKIQNPMPVAENLEYQANSMI